MSGRKAPRLALVGLLAVAFAAPAAAQEGGFPTPIPPASGSVDYVILPQAPMPKAKEGARIQIEVKLGALNGIEVKLTAECEPAGSLCCIGDCCRNQAMGSAIGGAVIQHSGCMNRLVAGCEHFGCGMPPRVLITQPNGCVINGMGLPVPQPACAPSIIGHFGTVCGPIPAPQHGSFIIRVGDAPRPPMPMMLPPAPQPTFTFPVAPPVGYPQIQMSQPCPPPPATRPQGCGIPNDTMRLMAADAFGDLLIQSGVMPPPPMPQVLPGAVPGIVGTWYRDIGPKRSVIQMMPDHLTICVSESREVEGKPVTATLTFTADYHMTRDGVTVVGLITSVDMAIDGDMPESEADAMLESIAEFRKAMEDKPFAMTCRVYGDSLVIGNVRLPAWKEREQPSSYIGGRYTSTLNRPLPKLKTIRATGEPQAFTPYGSSPGTNYIPPPPIPQEWSPYSTGPVMNAPPCPNPPPGAIIEVHAQNASGVLRLPAPSPYLAPPVQQGTTVMPCPTPVVRPEPQPSMPTPTPPQPTMSEPTPPNLSLNEPTPVKAAEMAVVWRDCVVSMPDPARNGAKGPCIAGQLFLFNGTKLQSVEADGTLTVDLIDETPRPIGQKAATPERWQLNKAALKGLRVEDETFGKSYEIVLPWPAYKPDITKVRLSVRYDPDNGITLYARPSVVTVKQAKEVSPPAQLGDPLPSLPPLGTSSAPLKIQVPPLGPVGLDLPPLPRLQSFSGAVGTVSDAAKRSNDHRQLIQWGVGLFGSQ